MKDNTIYLGLTLAGAVSAGAYTAGVMDFLFEALDKWENRKKSKVPGTPTHRVEIPIIGGSSAGGMTGIIAAAALQDSFLPVATLPSDQEALTGNKFYDSWVHLTGGDMFAKLLDKADLSSNPVRSAFNTNFIDEISERTIKTSGGKTVDRDYIAKNLKVFVTMSNLKGFEYDLGFRSDVERTNEYIVKRHNDYACFVLNDGTYNGDGWIPLNFANNTNTDLARQTAIATGAFPIGLKARYIKRHSKYIIDNPWININGAKPKVDSDTLREDLMVDGGMINNEPFGYVEDVLKGLTVFKDIEFSRQFKNFRSTTIMIDPFPSEGSKFEANDGIVSVGGKVLGAMMNQSRTKPDEVIKAFQSDSASHYLISPKRYFPVNNGKGEVREGGKAVACGFLGGFGGFINKQFRIHDYFLGRANCERFLRHQFTVPKETNNKVIQDGYKGITDTSLFQSKTDKKDSLQIIPLFSKEKENPYLPDFGSSDWPKVNKDDVWKYKKELKKRVGGIISITDFEGSWISDKVLIPLVNRMILRSKAAKKFLNTVEKDMNEYGLLD